jgi:hypothetical protein
MTVKDNNVIKTYTALWTMDRRLERKGEGNKLK